MASVKNIRKISGESINSQLLDIVLSKEGICLKQYNRRSESDSSYGFSRKPW